MDHDRWQSRAACKGKVDEIYRPHAVDAERAIITLCRQCEVKAECLAEEVSDIGPNPQWVDIWGVRGGLSAPQRRKRYCQ